MTFDCSPNGGKTHDFTNDIDITPSDVESMRWSLSDNDTKLVFSSGSYPLVLLSPAMTFTISVLDASNLVISAPWNSETWSITFGEVSVTPDPGSSVTYHHNFVQGDWGIGSDPSHKDYYFDWGMTNPDTLTGISWTLSQTNNSNPVYDAGGYFEWIGWAIQLGSYSSRISDYMLSSSDFSGTITRVKLGFEADNPITVSCTVGGNSFGTAVNSGVHAEFSGSGSGEIIITLHSTDNIPAFLEFIEVEYTTGGAPI